MLVLAYGVAMRAAALPTLLLLLAPTAVALGEVVDLTQVVTSVVTMAERTFHADVTMRNKGAEPRTVILLAALYAPDASPCGPSTEPGFRQFTHLVQERITLQPGESRAVASWPQKYRAEHATQGPSPAEWCVFVAEDGPERLDYLDYERVSISVRRENQAPTGTFTVEPASPVAARDARFRAEGSDADGDEVAFLWDFGHVNASGVVRVQGPLAAHSYYPDGTYRVTLTVTDGLDDTVVTREVRVLAEEPPKGRDAPLPLILPWAAPALAALATARRRRSQ